MYTVKNYSLVSSLEEAWELRKKSRNNVIIGGNLWLRMGKRSIQTAIDLSLLGLDRIEETEDVFSIGCMVTLRQLETHQGLNDAFQSLFREAVRHIVGVQFRNCATVGGSIYPRFGFSDVLTAFMACDSQVELYHAGRMPLKEFVELPRKSPAFTDILVRIHVRKDGRKVACQSFRMTETDFPVLTCAVAKIKTADGPDGPDEANRLNGSDKANEPYGSDEANGPNGSYGTYSVVIGARPKCARLVEGIRLEGPDELTGLSDLPDHIYENRISRFADQVNRQMDYGSNLRGSAEYRKELSRILIGRCIARLHGQKENLEGPL